VRQGAEGERVRSIAGVTQRCFYQDAKKRLPPTELADQAFGVVPVRNAAGGLYSMVFENRIKYEQMIQKSAAQDIGVARVGTIFKKMELFRPFCRAGVAIGGLVGFACLDFCQSLTGVAMT